MIPSRFGCLTLFIVAVLAYAAGYFHGHYDGKDQMMRTVQEHELQMKALDSKKK